MLVDEVRLNQSILSHKSWRHHHASVWSDFGTGYSVLRTCQQ